MKNYYHHRRLHRSDPVGLRWFIHCLWLTLLEVFRKSRSPQAGTKRLYASSLAFKTLLALIPALAILMAVLADDAFAHQREQLLDKIVDAIYPVETGPNDSVFDPDEPKNMEELNEIGKQQIRLSVKKFAAHARKVGLIGFVSFSVIVVLLLRDVEKAFNLLGGITTSKPWATQFLRHCFFFIGVPLLVILELTVLGWLGHLDWFRTLFHGWFFSTAIPFLGLWGICAWMYVWMPNEKVESRAALTSGFLAAFLLEATRQGMNWYALLVVHRSHAYGALWMIPVILLWFYGCWLVILLGAEVTLGLQKKLRVPVGTL